MTHIYLEPDSCEPSTPIPAPLWSRSCSMPSPHCTTCCSTRRVPRWQCAWQTGCRRWCPCSTRTTPSSWPSPPTACSSWPMATRRARWAEPYCPLTTMCLSPSKTCIPYAIPLHPTAAHYFLTLFRLNIYVNSDVMFHHTTEYFEDKGKKKLSSHNHVLPPVLSCGHFLYSCSHRNLQLYMFSINA